MNNYYYILSFLPSLDNFADFSSFMTKNEFLSSINGFLSSKNYNIIKGIINDEEVSYPFLKNFLRTRDSINKAVLYQRSVYLNKENSKYTIDYGTSYEVLAFAKKLVYEYNPLQAQLAIIDFYSKGIDGASGANAFSFKALVLYALKLKLLYDSELLDKEKGRSEFNNILTKLRIKEEDLF